MRSILILLLFTSHWIIAQTGINTDDPKVSLHIKADLSNANAVEGLILPQISGNELKAKDNLYGSDQKGAVIYVTSAANPTSTKTALVTKRGYFYFDGEIWHAFENDIIAQKDATRFLGGTVYVTFNSTDSVNTPPFDRDIPAESNGKYTVGTVQETPSRGGIVVLKGNGYTISNPQNGIFDIKFDKPYQEIYGISVDLLDSYGGIYHGGAGWGTPPDLTRPGNPLYTNDNTQVSFISNTIIRLKTGDNPGNKSNRSFTFLVTGR